MKRFLMLFWLISLIANIGCKKKDELNVSTFTVYAANFYPGQPTTASIFSSLKDGDYFACYRIVSKTDHTTGSITSTTTFSARAPINIKNGKGLFTTPVLSYPESLTLTIDSVLNVSGKSVAVSATTEFHDSTGIMIANVNGVLFTTHRVHAKVRDSILDIIGETGTPGKNDWSQISVQVAAYSRSLSASTISGTVVEQSYYFAPGMPSVTIAGGGKVTFSNISPIMTGTFSFTSGLTDGFFNVAAP